MKTLIVYYSFTLNNEMLAQAIQKKLRCDIHRIEEVEKRNGFTILLDQMFNRKPKIKPHPYVVSTYDQCIFIAPVWSGKIASPLATFLMEEKKHINRYSFITVCSGSADQENKLFNGLVKLLEQEPGSLCGLWINDLLPVEKRNKIKYTTSFRIRDHDLLRFDSRITAFLKATVSKSVRIEMEKILNGQ